MKTATVRALCVAAIAVLTLLPTQVSRMTAPANYGAHGLTTGFGRGRLDLPGIVSEGAGGSINLPREPSVLTVRLSGNGPIQLRGPDVQKTIEGSDAPTSVRLELPQGGTVSIESASRVRLHDLIVERPTQSVVEVSILAVLGILAVLLATRGAGHAVAATIALLLVFFGIAGSGLSGTFARIALSQLMPVIVIVLLILPLLLALKYARFPSPRAMSRLTLVAFGFSLALALVQLGWFQQPIPLGDPDAYLEMGDKFADAIARIGSPLGLGPILTDLQPYLALPATGFLYGLLRLLGLGLGPIYLTQAVAMALSVAALVSICETEIGVRAARLALGVALIHPSFSILPGIVQPEPFILAAWTMGALAALRSLRQDDDPRGLLGAGILLGAGLALHPQGLSFLLVALGLCCFPWTRELLKRPVHFVVPALGMLAVLLPVAAAEQFSKPLAHVLDKQFGFFAYTSPHPLGFWLYTDSDGWQGPLRIDDTTYQQELIAMKGDSAVSSTFADVAGFVARHPTESAQTVLTNLHRLWHQPDNPFAVPFVLPREAQLLLHRALVVLFVLGLPALLGTRLALLCVPFVMLSMTYPAYHVFNKYATPALPFTIIGASLVIDRLLRERPKALLAGLAACATGALAPAGWFARLSLSGDLFLATVRAFLWIGLGIALFCAVRIFGTDRRSRILSAVIGVVVLLVSSIAASRTDTVRGAWSASIDHFEATCDVASAGSSPTSLDPSWILVDVEARDAKPPAIEVNGVALPPAVTTMPTFGLATIRGHRDPMTFRQIWRAPISQDLLATGHLDIRVNGDSRNRLFGDIRSGNTGPRLSLGNWPHLSVYRLMHEGQYRLPVFDAPAQACVSSEISGRPGIALARIPPGEEGQIALRSPRTLIWVF